MSNGTSQSAVSADSLFTGAAATGALSKAALQVITQGDLGEDINAALGVSVDDVKASEVILVSQLTDDSSSIRFASNAQVVIDGHNLLIDSLKDSKQKDGILMMSTRLNRGLLFPYCLIGSATRLTTQNYNPEGGTPLYQRSIELLAAVIAKCQDFQDNGIPCRTITSIVTDGGDSTGGRGPQAADVKKIVKDMLRAENHIIAGMGIDDGQTDFRQVFGDMGILPNWILTPGNNPKEIRAAFNMLSQSAVRASQVGGATFSKAAMGGGFGTP